MPPEETMTLRSEHRDSDLKRRRGHTSHNKQAGDADEDDSFSSQVVPEKDFGREDRKLWAAYLLTDGSGIFEPLTGRLKSGTTIRKASVCRSEKAAQRLIDEWQESYVPPVQ